MGDDAAPHAASQAEQDHVVAALAKGVLGENGAVGIIEDMGVDAGGLLDGRAQIEAAPTEFFGIDDNSLVGHDSGGADAQAKYR